jgi:predicted AlkP superfamily pyrophosphatase or phosphodiesterase
MNRSHIAVLSALSAFSLLAGAAPVRAEAPARPGLIVTLVIDQFGADLFNQYRARFTGGLKTLSADGLVYANGYQAHAASETCPGHSTVLTGLHPSRSGIPANGWYDRDAGRPAYCLAAPANRQAHGDDEADNGPVGPDNMSATSVGDWLKAASPESRVYAVSGKDRGAITLNGKTGDGAWWYSVGHGFTTWVATGQSATARLAPVADVNARIAARLAASAPGWTYTSDQCRALEGQWTIGGQPFRAILPPAAFEVDVSPILDEITLEAAIHLIDSQDLGGRGVTDMLGVSLSATDRIGHTFGNQGPEMCDHLARLDRALGAFLDRLETVPGGALVILTADHGANDFPERQAERGHVEARRVDPGLRGRTNAAVRQALGLDYDPLVSAAGGLVAVGADRKGLAEPLRGRVVATAVSHLRIEPDVAGAWSGEDIMTSPVPAADTPPDELTLLQRHRIGYVPGRSADLLVSFDPALTPGAGRPGGTVAGHGTPWDYDRRVPIIFWRAGAAGQERYLPISVVDIAPTLAAVLDLTAPHAFDGRCLELGLFASVACAVRP